MTPGSRKVAAVPKVVNAPFMDTEAAVDGDAMDDEEEGEDQPTTADRNFVVSDHDATTRHTLYRTE